MCTFQSFIWFDVIYGDLFIRPVCTTEKNMRPASEGESIYS